MRSGLKTLQRLAAVGSLSEFCRVADRKSLIDELNLVHDPSQRRNLQRLDFTTVLTAALTKGLELYVSSSSKGNTNSSYPNSSSVASDSKEHQHCDVTHQDDQHDQHGGTSTLQHSSTIPPLTMAVQESCRFLHYMAIVLNHWFSSVEEYPAERASVYKPLLTSEFLAIVPAALYHTAAHSEQLQQQLEQQVKQQRSSSSLQRASQPLAEMMGMVAALLNLSTDCCAQGIRLVSSDGETETASAACTTSSLAGTCAAIAAMWRCESVLQSCQGSASSKFDMGKYHLGIPMAKMCAKSAEHLTSHFSEMVTAAKSQPDMASEAAGLAAFSLDTIVEVVLIHAGLVIAKMHDAQHGSPSGPQVDGAPQNVPPYHEAFLQADGLKMTLPPPDAHQSIDPSDIVENCLPALHWALQCLCQRLEAERAAASSQQEGCCDISAGDAACFHGMRLLPLFPALLSELVALQPRLDVLSGVIDISSISLKIGFQLRLAAGTEQSSHLASWMKMQGLAITKGVFAACLEVLVPVQQYLATHDRSVGVGDRRHAACSKRQGPPNQLQLQEAHGAVAGCDQQADADPEAAASWPLAKGLAEHLFRVLAASMSVFDWQNGGVLSTPAWLPSSVCAGTALSMIEAGVHQDWAAEPTHPSTGLNLAIQAVSFIQSAAEQQLPALLECVTDSSKAPALLSLLLSCLKLLQSCTGCADSDMTRLALLSYGMAAVQLATQLISRAAADSNQAPATHHDEPAAADTDHGMASTTGNNSTHACRGVGSTGHSCDAVACQPAAPVTRKPDAAARMWLLLAGRALYTTGVTLQAALFLDDSSTDAATETQVEQQQAAHCIVRPWAADNAVNHLPELSTLQDCIAQLGSAVQQLAVLDGTAASVRGSKQLRVVLGGHALEAHTQLVAACAAASGKAYQQEGTDTPSQGSQQCFAQALEQLRNTWEGQALADSLLSFGSLLCAALPTRFCCNEPSCCCFDKPSELQLAAGKGSKCSACGTARYCGTADQRKHWKQHKHVCKALAAGKGKKGTQ